MRFREMAEHMLDVKAVVQNLVSDAVTTVHAGGHVRGKKQQISEADTGWYDSDRGGCGCGGRVAQNYALFRGVSY